jgi:hypothetical protein
LPNLTSFDQFSCVNSKNVTELQKAVLEMPAGVGPTIGSPISHLGRGFGWGPLLDGKVISKAPASVGVKVPSIFGSTASEGMLFVLATYSQNLTKQTQDTYDDFLTYQFGPLASRVNSTYPWTLLSAPSSLITPSSVRLTEAFRRVSPTGFLFTPTPLPVFLLALG